MSADWRNEQAILRDLAIAQGTVPVESVETVSHNEKPPSMLIEEETEEQFIREYAADGTLAATPDFGLIQDMLDLVRDVRVNDIDNTEDGDKRAAAAQKPPHEPANSDRTMKRNKNAAIESILNQQETNITTPPNIVLQPGSMFKPRTKASVSGNNDSANNESASNVSRSDRAAVNAFVPSSQAQEYYNKLMEAKRQRELREETVWTRAERQMREIDERRKNKVAD